MKHRVPLYTVLALTLPLTACDVQDPCGHLPPPTAQELAVVAAKPDVIEIEQQGRGGVDCELRDGRWQRESEE